MSSRHVLGKCLTDQFHGRKVSIYFHRFVNFPSTIFVEMNMNIIWIYKLLCNFATQTKKKETKKNWNFHPFSQPFTFTSIVSMSVTRGHLNLPFLCQFPTVRTSLTRDLHQPPLSAAWPTSLIRSVFTYKFWGDINEKDCCFFCFGNGCLFLNIHLRRLTCSNYVYQLDVYEERLIDQRS